MSASLQNTYGVERTQGSSVLAGTIRGTTNHYDAAVYDDAGNVTSDGARTFSFDPLSSMTRAVVAGRDFRYLYSADDERIAAVERVANPGCANKVTFTIRDFANRLLSEWRDDSVSGPCAVAWKEDEIWGGGRLLGNDSAAYGTRHYILDHLGSPRAVADSLGTFIGSQEFAPFGSGGTSNGGALQFTGHERDAANLGGGQVDLPDYMHARFYSAAGRFLSVDPVIEMIRAMFAPQMWNRYAYVVNNPIRYVDSDGRFVRLEGSTEERQKLLELIRQNLAQEDRHAVTIGENGMLRVAGKGSTVAFSRLKSAVQNKKTIDVGFGQTAMVKPGPGPVPPVQVDVQNAGGGLTTNAAGTMSGNIEVRIDPRGNPHAESLGIVMGHELMGHGIDLMFKGTSSEHSAINTENLIRLDLGMPLRPNQIVGPWPNDPEH